MSTPVRVDTVTFVDGFDYQGFARSLLSGSGVVGSLPSDQGPLDWLARALPLLSGTPHEARLTSAIGTLLTDGDPDVRAEASRFFGQFPAAAGADHLIDAANNHRGLFSGVTNTDGEDLDRLLLRAIGARTLAGDLRAIDVARREALSGTGGSLIAALTKADPDWVTDHATEIVQHDPNAAVTILMNLERIGRPITDVGEKIAPLAAALPSFKRDLDRYIDDQKAKARILLAARGQ
jgi:hypothetical protein